MDDPKKTEDVTIYQNAENEKNKTPELVKMKSISDRSSDSGISEDSNIRKPTGNLMSGSANEVPSMQKRRFACYHIRLDAITHHSRHTMLIGGACLGARAVSGLDSVVQCAHVSQTPPIHAHHVYLYIY